MTELEYVIRHFDEHFAPFRGSRILLHGSRNYAEALIREFGSEYRFVGVASLDPLPAGEFLGLPAVETEEIAGLSPDLIILTERVRHAEDAYREIESITEQENIPVRNMYGIDERALRARFLRQTASPRTDWQTLAESCDAAVIELLDTFLARHPGEDGRFRFEADPGLTEFYRTLESEKKPVFFSVRKSVPAEEQRALMMATGLFGSEEELETHLLYREGEDLSFRRLKERFPDARMISVGYGFVNEYMLPACYGYEAYTAHAFRVDLVTRELLRSRRRSGGGKNTGALTRDALKKAIREADLISFDIFDTLIGRKLLYPRDLFPLWQELASARGLSSRKDLAEKRKEAEHRTPDRTLPEIYEDLAASSDLDAGTRDALMELELRMEEEFCFRKDAVYEMLLYAREQGKPVVLTSDMYLTAPLMERLLGALAITGWEKLFISCDHRMHKRDGLFRELRRYAGEDKVILHVGDDPGSDAASAEKAGLRSFYLPSALNLAREAGWEEAVDNALSLRERCLLGLAISGIWSDPFLPLRTEEMDDRECLRRFGWSAAGPMSVSYLTALLRKARREAPDRVLFAARDGYLLIDLFREMARKAGIGCPAGYFYTSRHAAYLNVSDDPELLDFVILSNPGLTPRELLLNCFGLREEQLLPPEDGESVKSYILRHAACLRERAARSRKGLLRYLEGEKIRKEDRLLLSDFVGSGTSQALLERVSGLRLRGFYFGEPLYPRKLPAEIEYYLSRDFPVFLTNYIEMESVLTSPEPSLDCYGEDGAPVFSEEVRSEEEFARIRIIKEALLGFAEEYIRLFWDGRSVIRPELPAAMYAAEHPHYVLRQAYDDWGKRFF